MSRHASHYAAGALATLLVVAPPAAGGQTGTDRAEVVVTLRDEAIDESSGAVVQGRRLFTVNDSGDGPYLYEVDLRTGETVGVTTFAADEPEDVEALAPGVGGALWVGDIGDNRTSRDSIHLYRVVPQRGGGEVSAPRYELEYPDGAHNAEALLVHPRTGRVLVVTKTFARGGTVYRAPRRLDPDGPNRLEKIGAVAGMVTDGAFLPGGDRLLLRTYGSGAVYAYPAVEEVTSFGLPAQEQGEAVAVGDDGRVYLTSEGERSDVLVMDLPSPGAGPSAEPSDDDEAPAEQTGDTEPSTRYDPEPWMGLGPAGLLLAVLGSGIALGLVWWLVRASRRRGRRRP
ncbi:MAG TPA: hypothetical protein VFR87_19165 [Nocardioidaceae bacterium]|nr:hypothetical protein [Nocardioidaceae bacterium]